MKKEIVHTGDAATTGAPLVQAVKLGNLVFCSGASPRDPKQGNKVVEGGFQRAGHAGLEKSQSGAGSCGQWLRTLPEGDLLHHEL